MDNGGGGTSKTEEREVPINKKRTYGKEVMDKEGGGESRATSVPE